MSVALVTGSAGFVGRHFTAYLRRHDWRVREVDIKTGEDARDTFREDKTPYDLVIHAAAVVGGRKVIEGDPLSQFGNFELDAGLFQWARRVQPGRVVYFSSSAAYPVYNQKLCHHMQLRESMLDFKHTLGMPDEIYGWSKVNGERLAMAAREHGVKVTIVRPFSGYGEDQDSTYPFPAFIDRALREEDPFEVWGDGQQVRDFIHIQDIVTATMLMVREGLSGPLNLGTGVPTSMLELARLVTSAAGYAPEIRPLSSEPSGVQYRVADIDRMFPLWNPRVKLKDGIVRALEWRSTRSGPYV